MQMNMNILDNLQIQARRRRELSEDFALVFVGSGKWFKVRESIKANAGTVKMQQHDTKLGLGIVLAREGSTLSFILHSLRNIMILKKLRIQIENNYANDHLIFRVSSDDTILLFYHESKTNIEIRRFNSLKLRGSLDLIQICNKFNLLGCLNEIRVSLDFDYISYLEKMVLMLANQLILVKKDFIDQAEVLFDCSKFAIQDRLIGVRYNSDQKVLLVSGTMSYFLFGIDSLGVSYSRKIICDQFGRSIRLLGWDPKDEFIVLAQRVTSNKEHYHLIDYRASDPMIINLLRWQPVLGTHYDSKNHRLFYVHIGEDQKKEIRIVNLKDFRERFNLGEGQSEHEIECDTDHYTSLPPIPDIYVYFLMKFVKGALIFKRLRAIDEKTLKDIALRL